MLNIHVLTISQSLEVTILQSASTFQSLNCYTLFVESDEQIPDSNIVWPRTYKC